MGKRAAEVELFVGNMSSIQREDTVFYAKRRIASHDNRTRTNSRQGSVRAETPVYVSCSSHHEGTGLDESVSYSSQVRARRGWADRNGGAGEIGGMDRRHAAVRSPSG